MDTNSKKQTVLITGGRTLLGRRLTEYLRGKGYRILWLTRDVSGGMDMCDETFYWDIDQSIVAEHPLKEADIVIHLAGARLDMERWTLKRKREIIRSRVRSARVLINALSKTEHKVHTFIFGSSLSYYDHKLVGEPPHESELAGQSFIAQTFALLEEQAQYASDKLGVRSVVLRNGVILDPYAGVLPNLIAPVRFGLNTPLGSGEQAVNWVHQQDLCRIYEQAIRDTDMIGVYNASAPAPVSNSQLMYALSSLYGRDHLRVPLSGLLVRTAMGEMSERLLYSRPASVDKLLSTGFRFNYQNINQALRACLAK